VLMADSIFFQEYDLDPGKIPVDVVSLIMFN
jgi:hypothetical protein